MDKFEYLDIYGKKWTDYHNSGVFALEKAGELVVNHENALISPDASGLWLVLRIKEQNDYNTI